MLPRRRRVAVDAELFTGFVELRERVSVRRGERGGERQTGNGDPAKPHHSTRLLPALPDKLDKNDDCF
jgi:hypothetical protein